MEFNKSAIQVKHLLKEMERYYPDNTPIPFSIIAVSCNYARNEGGEILLFEGVIQAKQAKYLKKQRIGFLPTSSIDSVRPELANRIRRIFFPVSAQIRNVNIRFITHFKSSTDTVFRRVAY